MPLERETAPLRVGSSAAWDVALVNASEKVPEPATVHKFPASRLSARRWGAIRLGELKRLATWRRSDGQFLPAEPWLFVLSATLAVAEPGKLPTKSRRAPFVRWHGLDSTSLTQAAFACGFRPDELDEAAIEQAVTAAKRWQSRHPGHRLSGAKCGEAVQLSTVERENLDLRTIDAMDEGRTARGARKAEELKKRDRERKRAERGRQPRERWLADRLTTSKPWKAAGVSRATWYRRQRETGVSIHLHSAQSSSDTPVSRVSEEADRDGACSAPDQRKPRGREAGLRPFHTVNEQDPTEAAPAERQGGPRQPQEMTMTTNEQKIALLRDYQPEGSRKILRMIDWMREDEARFRRDVATLEAGLAKAA